MPAHFKSEQNRAYLYLTTLSGKAKREYKCQLQVSSQLLPSVRVQQPVLEGKSYDIS